MLRPLLHFIVLGGLVFGVVHTTGLNQVEFTGIPAGAAPAGEPVGVDSVRRAQLAADWRARFGADPSEADMHALVAHALDEEVLFREALRLGLDETDPVVRQRLAQNMRFLASESAEPGVGAPPQDDIDVWSEETDAWLARAHALDMHRTDVVVRRRLVQRMQAAIDATAPTPTLDEVRRFVDSNPELFSSAVRARVAYDFEAGGAGGARASGPAPGATARALPFGGTFDDDALSALFGPRFGAALPTLAPGTVTGPWRGPHGQAWVRVDEIIPPTPHPFEYVEERARELLAETARDRARRESMQVLRRRHGVTRDALAEDEPFDPRPEVAG